MKWVDGVGNFPARSENGLYEIQLLASPESHFLAFHRKSLFEKESCGEPRPSIDAAKADAEVAFELLQVKAAA